MAEQRAELTVPIDVAVPADVLWAVVSDLEGQSDWMLGTTVRITAGDGRSVGTELRAVTGAGPVGVADTMRVTEWTEPAAGSAGDRRIVVEHTGAVIRGAGVFTVTELGPSRSRFLWSELLDLPFGPVGRLGWPVVRPAMRIGVARSLRAMATRTEQRHRDGGLYR
ncbi:SRPBCC family protein [Pseudonocardia sp. HH130630-07]|uniref:SRPBCC family protein n=1 Tax=Pseudonocardia sp. HH130630-07 TaxID=1690815 RepID=UPI000814FA01|nr:SRPBCC family protein [Pseudonocardia sp. HH130630-07]ANY05971.1 polyketide cyclase [Pseudonocardia sp. HH130630-07]